MTKLASTHWQNNSICLKKCTVCSKLNLVLFRPAGLDVSKIQQIQLLLANLNLKELRSRFAESRAFIRRNQNRAGSVEILTQPFKNFLRS